MFDCVFFGGCSLLTCKSQLGGQFFVQEVCCLTSKPIYCQLTKTGADIFQKVFKEIDMNTAVGIEH